MREHVFSSDGDSVTVVTVQNAYREVLESFIYKYYINIIYIDKQIRLRFFIVTTVTTLSEGVGEVETHTLRTETTHRKDDHYCEVLAVRSI